MKRTKTITLFLILFVASFQVSAQLLLNEFMASNSGAYVDPDYDQSADWIEIVNRGSTAVSLNGYYITDNLNDLTKWQIKTNVTIHPGQYLVIWADGMDTGLHTNFKLSASGEELAIVSPGQAIIDSCTFGVQEPNISMGRNSNMEWVYFTTSTPGNPNSTMAFDGVVLSDPSFSLAGGIYKTPVTVELSTIFGGEVHYTLDGSEPKVSSPVASFPIEISENTVVRARIYKPGQVMGPIKTNSYFIDTANRLTNLPIVSLSSAPDNFWSSGTGIYAQSFKPEWEIPVNIELFENDGRDGAAFNLQAGVKVNGLFSWKLPQKMLGVYFRKAYGAGKLEYPLIFDKDRKSFDSFALRASGSDWSYTLFRDGLIQNATIENTDLDNSGFRACVVYINGKYMGIHNIREKIDEDFIIGNHDSKEGTIDMVENEDFAEAGDLVAYNKLKTFYTTKDLTVQENMDSLATMMDVENFTDLICTEVISGNSSVDHNVMAWKPKDSGLWKWIIMDLDRGFFSPSSRLINYFISQDPWPFKQLMTNAEYKKYFGLRLANHLFTSYNPVRIDSMIELHKNTIAAEIPYHIERWKGTSSSYGNPISSVDYWLTQVEAMKSFIGARPSLLLNDLKNFGFQSPVSVSVSTYPSNAGNLTFNGMKLLVPNSTGGYPGGEEIKLVAEPKAGYTFMGWQSKDQTQLINMGSTWSYSDTGSDLGTSWNSVEYDDSSWKSGEAEMGYGDGDEKTTLSYGTSSSNKYPTYYFRKVLDVTDKESIQKLTMSVKYDDGAVVYVDGVEVQRVNMPVGTIYYSTYAASTSSGTIEFEIDPKLLVNGKNVIAVEVHQANATSSDISFNLGLSAVLSVTSSYISTSKELIVHPTTALNVTAVFQNNGQCILPAVISDEYTVSKECSPILVPDNVQITSTGKLIIEPGVELWMSDGVSIFASGAIQALGSGSEPILFKSNPESANKKWGVISIKNVSDTSCFKNVILENASKGPRPIYELAALSIAHSQVIIDSVSIDHIHNNPIAAYNSTVSLTNSKIHTDYDGADFLNVKLGKVLIDHCEFSGNDKLDVDAIDFGDLTTGSASVTNSYFHDFTGFNSDAVDLGDHSKGVVVDGIVAYNIQDKGVSIGQQSSTRITNSVFLNCGMGAGMKDSSSVVIDHCTYYGNNIAIANYQKHAGDAGANALVTNSILSNSYTSGYQNDDYSAIQISNSSDDTEQLPEGNNLFGNPMFTNPTFYDFSLLAGSPLIGTAIDGGNIGANITLPEIAPSVMISDIAYFTEAGTEDLEFIGLYNPGNTPISLDSYMFNKGVTFQFPAGTAISPKEKVFVTSNPFATYWENRNEPIYQWASGRLADEGEMIQLADKYGMIIDQVTYNNNSPWPTIQASNQGLTLKGYDMDNHFGESWKLLALDKILTGQSLTSHRLVSVNQDPSTGVYTVTGLKSEAGNYEVFNLQGRLVQTGVYNLGKATVDLAGQADGIYFIRLGEDSAKIIRMK
ncbi:MAG: lamin tail domain-containing protein [Bacteroidales bacterium]|nr:lamin tail domain-containing protein [Bacteroidales bacterium]